MVSFTGAHFIEADTRRTASQVFIYSANVVIVGSHS